MIMAQGIKNLIAHEAHNGTIQSAATAYAIAIGMFRTDEVDVWKKINFSMPAEKREKIKANAWRKYNAMITTQ